MSRRRSVGKIYQVRIREAPSGTSRRDESASALLRFQTPEGLYCLEEFAFRAARRQGFDLEVVREIDESSIPLQFVRRDEGVTFEVPPEDARSAVIARLLAEDRARGEEQVRFLGRNRPVPPDGFLLDRAGGRRRYVWQVVPTHELGPLADLATRYPHLRELLCDPGSRVALSLGSGGLKLFAHATLLRLLEEMGVDESIDEIWGTSAGALAGLLYSHGLSPEAIEQTGYDLYAGRYDLSIHPSKIQVLRQLLRETLLPAGEPSHSGFVDCTESLSRMLDRYCATLNPRRRLYCLAFNLADCRLQVLTPEPVPPHLEDFMVHADPRDAALASSAVPLLMVPRRLTLDGRKVPFVDGSTTEEVPLHSVVRKWDLDREAGVETRERLILLYVKLTGTLAIYRTPNGRVGKLRLLQTIASAGMDTMHRRDVELISRRPDVRLIGINLPGSNPDFFEIARIPHFVRTAREHFPKRLLEIEEELARG